MNCFLEAVASIWLTGITYVNRKALDEDLVVAAKEQLREAISKITVQQGVYNLQHEQLVTEVREKRATTSKANLKKMLLRSRRLRLEQKALQDKANLMENQLTALESNEFNKTVLSTLQTSAKAMQRMGLNKDLQQTDQVIADLEEGMQYSQDVTSALGSNIGGDWSLDDEALDAELNDILGLEQPQVVFVEQKVYEEPEKPAPEKPAPEKPAEADLQQLPDVPQTA